MLFICFFIKKTTEPGEQLLTLGFTYYMMIYGILFNPQLAPEVSCVKYKIKPS